MCIYTYKCVYAGDGDARGPESIYRNFLGKMLILVYI